MDQRQVCGPEKRPAALRRPGDNSSLVPPLPVPMTRPTRSLRDSSLSGKDLLRPLAELMPGSDPARGSFLLIRKKPDHHFCRANRTNLAGQRRGDYWWGSFCVSSRLALCPRVKHRAAIARTIAALDRSTDLSDPINVSGGTFPLDLARAAGLQ